MEGSSHFDRRTPARALLAALLAVLLCSVFVASAQAVPLSGSANPLPGSSFEGGDGDQDVDGLLNDDWESVVGSPSFIHFPDPQLNDQIFKGGSKENAPALWDFVNQTGGSTPGKNNILDAYAYVEDLSDTGGDTFLHLAFTREDATGTTFMAFELNQRADLWDNGIADDLIPCRTTGDIIVSLQVSGNDPDVILQEWTTTATDPDTGCATAGTLTDFTAFVDNVDAQGAVNDAPIPNLLPSSFDWPGDVIPTNLFVEASLNLTTLLESLNDSPCFSFGSIWMHTRASTSDESNLDDYIAPQPLFVGNCTASGVKYNDLNGDGDRDAGEPGLGGFRIWADYDNDGELDPGEPFDDTDPVTGAYSISGIQDPSGTYSLREMLTPPATGTGGWICSQPATPGTNGVFPCAYLNIDGEATPNVTGKDFGNFKPGEIELDKVADDATVSAGDPIGFTLTVSNTGEGLAHDVTLTDTLPSNAGLSWSESPDNPDCSITAGVLSCDFGDLAPGASASVHISSATTFASCGVIDNTGMASSSGSGSDEDSDSVTVQCPDLDVVKTADAASVSAGDPIGFTVTVHNNGPGVAKGVTLEDPLPTGTGVVWVESPDNPDCSIAANTLSCDFGDLASGATRTVHVTSPTTAASCKAYLNTASVSAENHPDLEASATTTVNCGEIQIVKVADAASVNAGDPIGFTITVTNTGDGTAKDVLVSDTLPGNAGLSWSESPDSPDCSIAAGVLTCDFGDLAPDATRSVHISSPTTAESCGAVNNTASVTTSNDGTDEDSDSTFVDCPAIVVEKDGPATVYHGDQVTFTFKVTNPGNVGLTDVVVSDDTCSPVTGPTAKTGGNQDAVLEPGELWTYTCTMSVPAHQAGEDNPIVNTVTATGTDRNGGHPSDTDSHSTRILHPAIDIEKTGPATATAGSVLSYTLTVKNTGDSPFVSVVVTDPGCDDMPTLTSKNGDPTPATLDPGVDAWTYVCSHATTAGQSSFTNVANVTGRDRNNRPATDTDSFPTVLNQVLPEPPVVRGTARLRGPSGCVRGPFRATVRGSRIARVTFFVDGKRFRRITAPNGEGSRFSVRINPRGRGFGVHRVTARVQFAAGAQTKTRTLRLSFQRCKRQVVRPRFTG